MLLVDLIAVWAGFLLIVVLVNRGVPGFQELIRVMTALVMQRFKMEVGEEVVLVILIFQVLFQIYLKIFLVKVLEVEDVREDQTIEAQI